MKDGKFSICVLGSSHTGCVVTAWRKRAFPVGDNISLTFFAARSLSLANLELEGRALVPQSEKIRRGIAYTSGGKERVEIDEYNAFVTIALGFSIKLAEFSEENGTTEHLKWGPVPNLLSRACFEQTIEASFESNVYLRLVDKIRAVSTTPILNMPRPYPPESLLDEEPLKGNKRMHDPDFLAGMLAASKSAAHQVATRHATQIAWPPADTMGLPGFTKSEFARGALALKNKPRDNVDEDGKHMNEDYGYRALNAIFAKLDEMTGGGVIARQEPRKRGALAQ